MLKQSWKRLVSSQLDLKNVSSLIIHNVMTIIFPSGAEMERICLGLLLMSKALSVIAQFNGFNCDANFHSRFPGKTVCFCIF